ncbi:MAG: hypothetical protein PVH84_15230 [Candidatus Aminicenantes bacterium]|jgi:hypothetical protein
MLKKNFVTAGISVLIICASVFLYQCGSDSNPNSPSTPETDTPIENPSFSQDIQSIFNTSCATSGCHNSVAEAGLNLLQSEAYSNIVNVDSTQVPSKKRVLPNDAQNSYLVEKIEGRQSVGSRMPLNRSALSSTQIQNIRNWINQGAQNN